MSNRDNSLYSRDLKYMLNRNRSAVLVNRPRKRGRMFAFTGLLLAAAIWWLLNQSSIPFSLPSFSNNSPQQSFTHHVESFASASESSALTEEKPALTEAEPAPTETIITPAPLPLENQPAIENVTTLAANWKKRQVKRGDTLGQLFKKMGLNSSDAVTIAGLPEAKILRKLKPGDNLYFGFNTNNEFIVLRFPLDAENTLIVKKQDDSFLENIHTRELEIREKISSSQINSSLFKAGNKVGLSDRLIMDLVSIFGWDIDFALDLRQGDEFTLVFQEKFWEGEKVSNGGILAAEFINDGTVFRAIRHVDETGYVSYYTPTGMSLRRTFLKTPVEFSRITSGFKKKRFHPVLKKWRAHNGIDYAAPAGTPILATADGKINFIGRKGGYGKTVVLKHGGKYSTLYGHMSKFKSRLRSGQGIRQGDVIGFVGKTGLATGPHLHYEFRVAGVHKNPLKHKQPDAMPIKDDYRNEFESIAAKLTRQLDVAKAQKVASN